MQLLSDLYDMLSTPTAEVVESVSRLDGDLMLLGVGGKLGPELALMARRALDEAGSSHRVIGVARSLDEATAARLRNGGVELAKADLLDTDQLAGLPSAPNVIYLAGRKFGTSGGEHQTWVLNSHLPGRVAERFRSSRIVAFSTGNVYPLMPVTSGGAHEATGPGPVGEYAQSCLGRERVFEHYSRVNGTPVAIARLNYAVEMRYGVLLEVARTVAQGDPVDLRMGTVNVIWQGDVNASTLRLLDHCESPPFILNLAGPETVSVRWIAERFGELLGVPPTFAGTEEPTALLSNASKSHQLFGYPQVTLGTLLEWTAEWVRAGGATHGKGTHFQEREGRF
ncbi:NAD(P)-dependent oxidoreductase [Kribbella turkmenica]|uniref:NAD(P)-dependent oxidoreductase n=1 Tax=Kribbella turkmenica TaxID=2530375 RepID=A0A4R4WZZ6_9ACTN|nr:NAD(P)-dependent oxidoreductase [Kribbella turkmenica]TDD23489.1 NAD(P)-dependent oxidoreductase [Kribbella turkmenica]